MRSYFVNQNKGREVKQKGSLMVAVASRREINKTAVEMDDHFAAFCEVAEKAPESTVLAAIHALTVAIEDESKAPFITRALNALAHLAEVSTKRSLRDAVSATTDTMVLLEALDNPEALAEMGADDELVEAHIRGALAKTWLLETEGGVCSAEELGEFLHISRQAVDKRRKTEKLLALDLGRHGYGYPMWQIHEGRVLSGLDRVIVELREYDPWTQVGFMLSPNSWLGGETPLAELRLGNVDRVLATVRMLNE